GLLASLVEPGFSASGVFRRWQPEEGQKVAGHEVRPGLLEPGLALGVDQGRRGIGKETFGIGRCLKALRFDKYAPARTQPAEGIVDAPGDRDQFGGYGRIQIGTAELCTAL